ncbi:MAG TPA: TonB family protein [Thermoanaerobaculia bacterium]|nr:TonB family protein [Thermoanaerobaculia bacterium]
MFETSVVRAQTQTARGRVSVLTASVMAHSVVILGAMGMSIASVDFPKDAPAEYALFMRAAVPTIPPPLGNPNGGAKPKPQIAAAPKQQPAPTQQTAPAAIPDTISDVPAASNAADSTTPGTGAGTEAGPLGVPWGQKDSIGDLDAPPVPLDVPAAQPEERIYQAYEVKAPVLITRVDPRYPQALIRTGMPATVVVHCVIDRNGSVRDPEVVSATMPPFAAEVLRVMPQWRYKAATYNGRVVDSYLNLTVTFGVRR